MVKSDNNDGGCQWMKAVNEGDTMGVEKCESNKQMSVQIMSFAAPLTPSSGQSVQSEKDSGSGAGMEVTSRVNKCIIKNMKCITHNCEIKKVKEKVKR